VEPQKVSTTPAENAGTVAKTKEQRRLSAKIAALVALREELEAVREGLGADAKTAKSLNAIFVALRKRVGEKRADDVAAAVRTARAGRKQAAKNAAAGRARLPEKEPLSNLQRLTKLQQTSHKLMAAESAPGTALAADEDRSVLEILRQRLAAEQEATRPVLAAAELGRQALIHVDELKEVVGELAKIAEAEGRPENRKP